jgi:hypothetical protein
MHAKGLVIGGLVAALVVGTWVPLWAQRGAPTEPRDWPLALANILASGQPVIPLFEAWIKNPDDTITFSFGYLNMNLEEELDIPLGPDNFIEPRKFDGLQPTHFDVATKEPNRNSRQQAVFSVVVPPDYKGDVVWTLRVRGKTYSSPARATREEYGIDDLESLTFSPVAPVLRFGTSGASGRGRRGFMAGPVKATVGEPLPVSISIDLLSRSRSTITWYHHQGPGRVTFDPKETVVKANGEAKTTATFSQPGDYMLRVTALEHLGAMDQHCCYTNGYVKVAVTE